MRLILYRNFVSACSQDRTVITMPVGTVSYARRLVLPLAQAADIVSAVRKNSGDDKTVAFDQDLLLARIFARWKGHDAEALAAYDRLAEVRVCTRHLLHCCQRAAVAAFEFSNNGIQCLLHLTTLHQFAQCALCLNRAMLLRIKIALAYHRQPVC